jgi:prepilin-type processing-associated H-X9-DG protein/prepilin-type N-terminal cleavage/methylation domain-containing protein
MRSHQPKRQHAFTLVELLVVIGIIAVLIGVLLPALNKARQASRTAACLSNLRQMGNAWTMYLNDSKGRLPDSVWHNAPANSNMGGNDLNEFIWNNFWFGLLAKYRVTSSQLLCPEAQDPVSVNLANLNGGIIGAGTAKNAWSGQWQTASPVGIMITNTYLNLTNDPSKGGYRIGSYGFNGNLYRNANGRPANPGTGGSSKAEFGTKITDLKGDANHVFSSTDVPVFYDATWIDNVGMVNGTKTSQPQAPPDLQGSSAPAGNNNNDWRVLLARHGKGINVCFADGHASRIELSDTYNMQWTPYWVRYARTNLPSK